MSTDTFLDISLIEDELLGEPCHAICNRDTDVVWHGICGKPLRGEDAAPEDMLCSTCLAVGAEGICRVCKGFCSGVYLARMT